MAGSFEKSFPQNFFRRAILFLLPLLTKGGIERHNCNERHTRFIKTSFMV